jgi:NAD(P)-dependent dehydrogenase (short-subunit alcohol dehydrogenase family)/pimeloyl-ACP methyl ester carboxylesterase
VPRRLRHRGVYLITGGAGGLGLAFAKYLAESCQARIALTKKTAFPARSRWKELLNSQQTAETVRSTIKELLEIERLGGEVEVFVAEVTDHHQMQSVIDEVVGRFQTINGVFHAAGIVRAGLVQAKTKQVAASVLAPKLEGTRVLFERLKDMPLDFAVLFSSVSSITTPYAHVDYSAANCFLDAFANYFNSKGSFHTVAISWPVWKEVGIVSRLESLLGAEALKEQALERAILTKDGLDAFARALNSDLSHIIVSPEDLNHLLKEAAVPVQPKAVTPLVDAGARAGQPDGKGERQHRSDEIEAAIGEIWSGALGLDKIGVHDNFAQLGGHSLLAMQIVAKIRSTYRIKLALREFFEAPTISQLTAIVERRIAAGPGGDAEPQAPRPFSPMGQRLFSPTTRQTALFLGSDSRQIFAVYHPAAQDGCRVLTVICPPLFNEYMRTQLALRELAISLAEKGQHVVRFDYRGTGDSSGDLRDVSVSDWIDDIELAVREGSSLSGSSCVRLLAVRAGALIACKAAIARDGVERLVLWDPVPDGGSYLQKLRLVQEAIFARDTSLSEKDRKESLHDYGGYRLSERLAEEFGALETSTYSSVPNSKLYVVSTSPQANFPTHNQHLAPFAWNWETASENLIMPKAVLESLSTWLTLS